MNEDLGPNPVQDYIVTPDQRYLDGIAVSPGLIRQFVGTVSGLTYETTSTSSKSCSM